MKILFVLNLRENKSGITEQILYLKNRLNEQSIDVILVSTYGNIFERMRGILKTFLTANKSDLIVGIGCSYFGFLPVFVAAMAAFFFNKKILYNFHGGQAEVFLDKYDFFVRRIFKGNIIVVASDYLWKVFKSKSYNPVKINNIFDYSSFPMASDNLSRNKKVLWARSFEKLYQPEMALEVASFVSGKYDFEFHFFGDGSLYKQMRKKYQSSKIYFHGLVERKSLLGEYKNFSVLLNTTLNDNIPNTIFEAGFYKLLVVSSKVGGIATTFGQDEILFVENNDKDSYIEAFVNIVNNGKIYDDMRNNLYEKVIQYDWDNVKNNWLEILKKYEN